MQQPSLQDIRNAAQAIEGAVEITPLTRSKTLSRITGADVYVKFENLQFTASFKERGALNKLLHLTEEERACGVIAMSAGNHAQGVAYHAQRLGVPTTIVMPESTPFIKVQQTEGFGATVVLHGAGITEAAEHAHQLADERGLVFVHPFDDAAVIAGAGTIGLEIAEGGVDFDSIIVPVGGGGLIAGVAIVAKVLMPKTEIIGVEAELFPAMRALIRDEATTPGGATIAEGIAVARPGEIAQAVCRADVSDIVLVPEAAIERAIFLFLTIEKTVAEGAGATPLAALLQDPTRFAGKKVALILTGGNIDARVLSSVIMRELVRDGRIFKIAVEAEDLPGQLGNISSAVGKAGGSILEVQHVRMVLEISVKQTLIEFLIEAKDANHARNICTAIEALGHSVRRLS